MRAIVDRFLEKTEPIPDAGCWLWIGNVGRNSYGQFSVGAHSVISAHRMAWYLFKGDIPNGKCVLHRCDLTVCVNPDHLFLGTNKDNTQDMIAKGRHDLGRTNKEKTHCPSGHPYTGENLFWVGNGRRCRACARARKKK